MKRILLVFSNASTSIGLGLNVEATQEERDRLHRVAQDIKKLIPALGHTVVVAEYPNFAMVTGYVLSEAPGIECRLKSFVRFHGLIANIRKHEEEHGAVDTLIISCLSYYPDRRVGDEDIFFQHFSKNWNRFCPLFGMPMIPPHDREGDRALLLIDYEARTTTWFDNVGGEIPTEKAVEVT